VKKTITLVLVGLLAFVVLGPAAAKKKKPKKPSAPVPVEVQYFLRTEEACEAPFLSTTDGEDVSDCFFGVDDMFNEYAAAQAAIGDPVDHYVAADGLPLKLDAARKAVGTISIRGWNGTGVGSAVVDLTLKATIAGEEKELGTFSHSYTAGPNQVEQVDFEITIDPAVAGLVAEGLTLDVYAHGNIILGRGVEHDSDPAPSITIPAFK
jgi:hypothetical protein